MKSKAAVLRGVGLDWDVTEVELDPPHAGEVLVRMAYAGICHSDEHFHTGDSVPTPEMEEMMRAAGRTVPEWFPMLGGHEGSGVVETIGPEVKTLKPGDHVAISFYPSCGNCRWCTTGRTYLCDVGADIHSKAMTTDGTRRRHLDGEDLMAMMQVGTFSEYVVASERSLVKVHDWIPLDSACLVSCGVTTGFGSGSVAAGTEAGDTVVVVGVGGVGMNAVQGAKIAGAKHIVAVDPNEFKRQMAPTFGATHTVVDTGAAMELVTEITWGLMADRVILTPGVVPPDMVLLALMMLRKGGTCVLTGMPKVSDLMVPMVLTDMIYSCKTFKGALYGELNPREAMPRLLAMYEAGLIKLDQLITQKYKLDDINEAMRDLRAGKNIRGVITFE